MVDWEWPFRHQPNDTSFRAGIQDIKCQMALHTLAARLRGGKLDRSKLPRSQPTTVIDDKGQRRELDGAATVWDVDCGEVLNIYEHKYNYEPHAQLQLASGAGLALYNLVKPNAEYHGKPLKAQAILVVHGPSSNKIPPSVAELLGISEGTGCGFFDMGPCWVLDLPNIPLYYLYLDPEGMALWIAIGFRDHKVIREWLAVYLLKVANRIREAGSALTAAAILYNVQRALNDKGWFRRLMSESWGPDWEGEPMEDLLEQLAEEAMDRRYARGKIENLLRIAQRRFGAVPDNLEAQLSSVPPEELDSWVDRMFDAPSIDEAMKGNGSWGNGSPANGAAI